jgi:hypothetical protein
MYKRYVVTIAVSAIFAVGCQHAAMSYSLRRQGTDAVVFPPPKSGQPAESSPSSVILKNARQAAPKLSGCDISSDILALHWQGRTADVAYHWQTTFTAEADQSPMQAAPGMLLDPLLAIQKFRAELFDRQIKGCFSSSEAAHLRRDIVERFPLPPAVAYFFQFGSYDITGYFDLTPDFRIQITSPLYPPDTPQSPETLIGYETGNYSLLADGKEGRSRLELASAREVLNGAAPVEKRTLRNNLPFSTQPSYFRLVFMTEKTSSVGKITRAILLSAPDEAKLAEAVTHRQGDPDRFCAAVASTDISCTAFPKNFGVSPELRVLVNHKEEFVRIGGMVGEALPFEDAQVAASRTIKVSRLYKGRLIPVKFDRSSQDVFRLVLLPGDQISF